MENEIRDPVHGRIGISRQEKVLINSPLVQRLHLVKQLTGNYLVFPGGMHSRYLHSIGVMDISGKYMEILLKKLKKTEKKKIIEIFNYSKNYLIQLARVCGLLHDIGHGPFSHSWDRIVYHRLYHIEDGGHDKHRFKLIQSPMLRRYIEYCDIDIDDVAKVWNSKAADGDIFFIIKMVCQGPLGADRFDFTLRDSYFTGSQHFGQIDHNRIMNHASLRKEKNESDDKWYLCYGIGAIDDIIQALEGRERMYKKIYYHKTSMAANILIERMLSYSVDKLNLMQRVDDVNEFVWINDSTIIGEIMALPNMHPAKQLCKMLLKRKLPKTLRTEIRNIDDTTPDADFDVQEGGDIQLVVTRTLCGIDADKFEESNIRFLCENDKIQTCKETLENISYTPQSPYRIYRWYEWNK